jgi:hypothetical protein
MPPPKLDAVTALVKAYLVEECQAGFPKLSLVPSTDTIKFLDYFSTLSAADGESLLDALARVGVMGFFPRLAVGDRLLELVKTDPAVVRYGTALQSAQFAMGLRYQGLRMAKAVLTDRVSVEMMARTRATLDFTPRDDAPAALTPDPNPANLKPAKAPLLRKLIDKAFKELFATGKRKLPGGDTGYTGILQATNITVWIGFAGMGLQLRYGVTIPDETKTVFVVQHRYENLWAAGPGWDYLTEENAEASIHLLCDLVVKMVELRNGVIALM